MQSKIQKYINMGLEPDFAEYFASGPRILVSVQANRDFTLLLEYDDGARRSFDAVPLIRPGTVFELLADWDFFKRVYVDETNNIAWDIDPDADSRKVWSNRIDISADTCYVRGQVL